MEPKKKVLIIEESLLFIAKKKYAQSIEKLESMVSCLNTTEKNSFSIYIGSSFDMGYKCNLAYLLSKEYDLSTNTITIFDSVEKLNEILTLAIYDFANIDKKVLLYLGKFPAFGFDVDGGSILAKQLIDTLKVRCKLDVGFIRKNKEVYVDNQINNIIYTEYIDAFNNKFTRRMKNMETNKNILARYSDYDHVITAHTSKFFGMEPSKNEFWNKAILFPMFCTSSYLRANETVPKEYTVLEHGVINNVKKIITPSVDEKKDLIADYKCDESKISVIYRGIAPDFHFDSSREIVGCVQLIYIASIKRQKNNIESLKLLKELILKGHEVKLNLVCTIQDKAIYEDMAKFIKQNNLQNNVQFHIELVQSEIVTLMKRMHIGVSVSNWETFGRGIFECVSSGLPTFVYKKLKVIENICGDNIGVMFSDDFIEMSNQIDAVIKNRDKYLLMRDSLKILRNNVSYKREQLLLINSIFNE